MTKLLLNPTIIAAALITLAIVMPIASLILFKSRKLITRKRLAIVIGASGPWALALWGIHSIILKTIGFDSIISALLIVAIAGISGVLAGIYASREQ